MRFAGGLLTAVAAATALEISLSLYRGYILRTDVALLVTIDALMMALIAAPVLALLYITRWIPGLPSLFDSAPRASILLAAWTPVGLLRARRLSDPLSLLPELLLLALIFLVNLCAELAFRGGLSGLGEAFPEALYTSYQFLADLFQGNVEALEEMWRVLPRSLGLLAVSLALGIAIGLPLGMLAAVKRHGRVSGLVISASVLGVSTPNYVAAMFLIWSVVAIFRSTGVRLMPTFGFGWDRHLIMPALVLATRPMANMTRLSYSALIDIFSADYVRTAHSKGLMPRLIFWRHVLRNAGVPLLTTAGVAFRFSLAMLPIVEYIFSWPGIGLALLEGIGSGNVYRVLVMVLPLALLFTLVNLLLDFIYGFIDPRLRGGEGAAQ